MKNLILLTISLMVLFSTSLVFACGDGQDSSPRSAQSTVESGSDTSSSPDVSVDNR
mgnify:CR=1 FL=1